MCLSAGASIHAYQDTMAGIAYSWERDVAADPPIQRILPGRHILDCEEILDGPIRTLAIQTKLQRVSTYRQCQAISHMYWHLTGRSYDDLVLPNNAVVGLLPEGSRRVVQPGEYTDTAMIVDENRQCQSVLPADLMWSPLLVLVLDQGSTGTAAKGFSDENGMMIVYQFLTK